MENRDSYGEKGSKDPDYLKQWRLERRMDKLDKLVPQRRCPLCGRIRLRSRQWVILGHNQKASLEEKFPEVAGKGAVCRGCAMGALKIWLW